MKGRQERRTVQNNTYGWQVPSDTPDVISLRNAINQLGVAPDPRIQFEATNQLSRMENMLNNPFGGDYSAQTQGAIRYHQGQDIAQRAGMNIRDSYRRSQLARVGAMGGLAQMTKPQLVQTGGRGTVTQTGGGAGPWGAIAGGAMQGAGAAIA